MSFIGEFGGILLSSMTDEEMVVFRDNLAAKLTFAEISFSLYATKRMMGFYEQTRPDQYTNPDMVRCMTGLMKTFPDVSPEEFQSYGDMNAEVTLFSAASMWTRVRPAFRRCDKSWSGMDLMVRKHVVCAAFKEAVVYLEGLVMCRSATVIKH